MRQRIVIKILLERATEIYYKMCQILQSVTDAYNKVCQVLQSVIEVYCKAYYKENQVL